MNFTWVSLIALFALAGRVLAFNITLGKSVFFPDQILNIPAASIPPPCATNCTSAQGRLNGCNNDANCLCRADVVAELQNCQQCMFNRLIEENQKPLDIRVGSNPLMGAYATTCKSDASAILLANQTALTPPPSWDGPFVAVLPIGAAAVTVIAGGILGVSALLLLSNLE